MQVSNASATLDDMLEGLKNYLAEVKARGCEMIIFEDEKSDISFKLEFTIVTKNRSDR